MHRWSLCVAALLAVVWSAAGCRGPAVPHPATGQTRYLCCNLHYEKDEISDANYQKGTLVPLGTRVQILEVGRNRVKFQAEGHPPLTASLKYGEKVITLDTFIDHLFVAQDPRAKLPRSTSKKDASQAERLRRLIESGTVDRGMTREQVLMALGYPPAHRTPTLDAPSWTYWQNRWATFVVQFDGDRVSGVQR